MIEMVVLIVFTVENDFLSFKKFTLAKLPFLNSGNQTGRRHR